MSLRQYLSIGRSFDATTDRTGRYRQAGRGMPDFSARSSGAGPSALTGGGDAVVASADHPVVRSEPRAAHGSLSHSPGPAGHSPAHPEPRRSGTGAERAAASGGRRLPVWLEQLLLALIRPGKNRRRGTRAVGTAVQAELTFRRVQVARNDLMTADVEVVPVRPGGGQARLSAACRTRVLKLWWDQGAERLKRLGGALR